MDSLEKVATPAGILRLVNLRSGEMVHFQSEIGRLVRHLSSYWTLCLAEFRIEGSPIGSRFSIRATSDFHFLRGCDMMDLEGYGVRVVQENNFSICHCIDTDFHSLHTNDIHIDEKNSVAVP